MAAGDELDCIARPERIEQRQIALARNAKDPVDALGNQTVDEEIGSARHAAASLIISRAMMSCWICEVPS